MDPMQYLSGMALAFLCCGTFNVLDFEFCMDLPWLPKHKSFLVISACCVRKGGSTANRHQCWDFGGSFVVQHDYK